MESDELMFLLDTLKIERLKMTSRGNEITGLCPFHDEHRPSFGVSTEKLIFNCYGCRASGTLLTLVARLKKFTLEKALEFIEDFGEYGIELTDRENLLFACKDKKQIEIVLPSRYAPFTSRENLELAHAYLRQRGVLYRKSGTLTKTFHEIGYDLEQYRVMFPWYDSDGNFYGCTGRSIVNKSGIPRYMPYFGLKKSNHLFFGHMKWQRYEPLAYVIVEGEIDAIRVSQTYKQTRMLGVGLGNCKVSKAQVKQLREIGGPFVGGLDNDEDGNEGTTILEMTLGSSCPLKHVRWPEEDPGSCSHLQIIKALTSSNWLGV